MTILVDADGVLENLTEEMPRLINEKYGTDVAFEEITQWGFDSAFPGLNHEQIFSVELEEELYDRIRPIQDAPEVLKRLMDDGHRIFVVTNTPYKAIAFKMEKVMEKYFPYLSWENFIITSAKQQIKGDVLIDDGVHNLVGGEYAKLLFDCPCNRDFDAKANGMIRVRDWAEVYSVICSMSRE